MTLKIEANTSDSVAYDRQRTEMKNIPKLSVSSKSKAKNEKLYNRLHRVGVNAAFGITAVLGVVCTILAIDYVRNVKPVKEGKIRDAKETKLAAEQEKRELELLLQQQHAESDKQYGEHVLSDKQWKTY